MRPPSPRTTPDSSLDGVPNEPRSGGDVDSVLLNSIVSSLPEEQAERLRAMIAFGSQQAERVQLLQQIASALARTLDEDEIVRELVRGVQRLLRSDSIMVARVDLDQGVVDVVRHVVGDAEQAPYVISLGQGALAEAARTGAPVLVTPYDARVSPLAAADDVGCPARIDGNPTGGAALTVPMMHLRRLQGVMALYDSHEDAFDHGAREALATLATHAAAALSNARLFADSERERRQSEAMAEIARAVGESLRMGEVLRLILRHAMALLRAEGACVALRQDDYLHVVSALGIADLLSGMHIPVVGSLSGRVVREGTAVVSNDASLEPDAYRQSMRLVSVQKAVIVPLVTVRGIIGVLSVYNRSIDFSREDLRVLQRLADQVAVAIVNARLFEEVQDATREWSAAFESIGVGMVLVDDEGRITRFNSRALQLARQETPRTLIGRLFYEALLGAPPGDSGDPLTRAITDGARGRAVCDATGGRSLDITAVPHPNGGAIVTFDDVSSQRAVTERNRLIVDASSDALFTVATTGEVTFANPAALTLFGRDDVVGLPFADLVLPDMADEARAQMQLAVDGTTHQAEYVVVRGDGERRVVAAALAPLRERDQVSSVVVSMHDVTGERRARDSVALSEARYRNLFEMTSDVVFTLDSRGAFTSANPAACEVLDAPREQLLGRSLYPYLFGADVDRVTTFLRDTLEGDVRRYECTVVRRSGGHRLLSVMTTPIRHGRAIVGLLAVARDLTDERARAGSLSQSAARYAQLVESTHDAVFTLDEEGNFTSVNRAFEAATGRGRDDIVGRHFTVVLDPRDGDAVLDVFVAALHGEHRRHELRYLTASGDSRWGSLLVTPVVDGARIVGALGVVRAIATGQQQVDERPIAAPGDAATAGPAAPDD
jgi:PAS domain S-box-containing protein